MASIAFGARHCEVRRGKTYGLIGVALGLIVQGCGGSGDKAEAQDAPDPGPVAATSAEKAVIDATPQQSLSEEEREGLRDLASGYIDSVEEDLAVGYSRDSAVPDETVALQPTQTHDWKLPLEAGVTYRLIGGCDAECADMDLLLLDPTGKIVERDTLPDAVPVINITPPQDGIYTVRFQMKTCTIAPCYASTRLYRRTGSTDPEAAATKI